MLARGDHACTAKVAREIADVGYCVSRKLCFHGVRLHTVAQRRAGQLPCPQQIWLREGSGHDVRSVKDQEIALPTTTLIGDTAYAETAFRAQLAAQGASLHTPRKKPKGKELSLLKKYHNRCVSRLRQPVEGLFNWFNDKTGLPDAGRVRSEDALMIHFFGKLAFACFLLVFNP
jgi:Transposase DDE domain